MFKGCFVFIIFEEIIYLDSMYIGFFSFGGGEIFIVVIAVLVLFGANKIPDLARTLGKGMNEFRRATDELKREFREGADDFKKDMEESKNDIQNHIREINETISDTESYEPYSNAKKEDAIAKKPRAIDEEAIDSESPDQTRNKKSD